MSEELVRTDGDNVARLLAMAIDKGLGVEGLEKLVALQERVMDRQAAMEFSQAMADFQRRCPPIKKTSAAKITTQSGTSYGYTYAELDEIARTVNPILADVGLSYTWDSTEEGSSLTCICTLRHISGHSVSSKFTCPIDTSARMSGPQRTAAALTYARRQALVQVLGLTTTDPDTDGADGDDSLGVISEGQVADLDAMIDEVKADKVRFLKYMGIASLAELRVKDYSKAVQALEQRRR